MTMRKIDMVIVVTFVVTMIAVFVGTVAFADTTTDQEADAIVASIKTVREDLLPIATAIVKAGGEKSFVRYSVLGSGDEYKFSLVGPEADKFGATMNDWFILVSRRVVKADGSVLHYLFLDSLKDGSVNCVAVVEGLKILTSRQRAEVLLSLLSDEESLRTEVDLADLSGAVPATVYVIHHDNVVMAYDYVRGQVSRFLPAGKSELYPVKLFQLLYEKQVGRFGDVALPK